MTNHEKIVWLKRYTNLDRRIRNRYELIEKLRGDIGKITPTLSFAPPGGGPINKSHDHDTINRIVDLVARMDNELNEWIDIRIEISEVVYAVNDQTYQELLDYRYLQGWTFERIAAEMNYTWRHIHRLHSAALTNVVIECHN